ncbi:polymerase [Methylobacterium sp. Leaf104]|uniref:O-antigen ligase family protein n=1 Tax=Methylobacterium TaxID=407 RepID=UPI0006F69B61|nr:MULTISPECIES: O-antigen ligase family protein [Methylobacterium]KQP31188.1 polymerase [Methylobacterium sp. Leaf104]MCI9881282.1 O-antigen ligase family protein [Methylobacterium goesingense]
MAFTMAPGAARWQAGAWAQIPVLHVLRRLATLLLVAFIFFACFAFSDTSPYDVVAIPTIVLWLCLGLRLHRGMVPLLWLLILYVSAITVALLPYVDQPLPVTWTIQLAYLAITGVFFAMLFSDDTQTRMELALKTFVASCLLSSAFGIVGYFGYIPTEDLFYKYGRASGTFQDPNVFGSFLTLGALYLMHGLLLGTSRRPILASAILMVIVAGIFLSFSRGSWAGTLIAVAVMVGSVYATTPSARLRRRIVTLTVLALVATAVAIVGLLSIGDTAEMFSKRAAVTQDYDTGETGRFGNQMRGLGMLVDEPLGMGPLRWRLIFALEPHNTFIGSFANGGWLAGVTFIGLVLTTSVVGFRLMRRDTPYRRHAQIVFPALLMFFLQAFQIDIEKWRHVYMMLGMIWGLEAARLRWLTAGRGWHGRSYP